MKLFSQLLVIPVIFTAIYTYFSNQPTIYNNEPQWCRAPLKFGQPIVLFRLLGCIIVGSIG